MDRVKADRVKTYVDAGVLIAAFRGLSETAIKAMSVLDDDSREFVASSFLRLEVLPKAQYYQKSAEVDFYRAFFDKVAHWVEASESLVNEAQRYAATFGLAGMDAIHVAAAIALGAGELITTEKPTKPIHRAQGVKIISIWLAPPDPNAP